MGSAAVNPAARTPSVAAAAACLRIVLLFCSLLFLENILSFTVRERPSYIIYGSTSEIFVGDGCSLQSSHVCVLSKFIMDKKRKSGVPHRSGRRSFLGNQHTSNDDTEQTSVAAKKLKNADPQLEVKIHPLLTYVIVQWSVFATLQQRVVCAKCNKKVEFAKSVEKGLGFELQIICGCEESEPIPSSPKIRNGYEIHRRIVYAMRLLGVGFYGLLNFCGLMDISATALTIINA